MPTSRLELLRLFRPLAPQASVSTNFTTWAMNSIRELSSKWTPRLAQFGISFAFDEPPCAGAAGAAGFGFTAGFAGGGSSFTESITPPEALG